MKKRSISFSHSHTGSRTPPPILSKKSNYILWRPHNYRRQIRVKTRNIQIESFIKSTLKGTPHPQNKIITLISKRNKGITLQYMNKTVMGIYSQRIIKGKKQLHQIRGTPKEIDNKLEKRKEEIKKEIDQAIYQFVDFCKIRIPKERPIWSRFEDFIRGESYIDKIPKDLIIYDKDFKKVYGKGIEFIGAKKGEDPARKLRNYIKNRAIEDIAPDIAKSIREINPLRVLKQRIRKLEDVTREKELIKTLTIMERENLEIWLFEEMGIRA